MDPDPLDQHRIRRALAGQPVGHTLVFLEETTSTNDEASRLARQGFPDGTAVFAEHQSAGRGRRGARWLAPPRHDLLLSVVLRPPVAPQLWCRLTHLCALALHRAVAEATGVTGQVKWPNDLLIDGRKAAGILVEAHAPQRDGAGFAVAGIGLNVNSLPSHFPPEIQAATTSLRAASDDHPIARDRLAITLLRSLASLYPHSLPNPSFASVLGEISSHSALLGRPVYALVDGQRLTGFASALGPDGELILQPIPPDNHPSRSLNHVDLIRPLDGDVQSQWNGE